MQADLLFPECVLALKASALGLLLALQPAPAWAAPPQPTALAARIQQLISAPRFQAAAWGVKVLSLDSGRVLFAHHSDQAFTPASNAKLFTAALALQQLGPDFRIRTSLYGASAPDEGGVLHGDLTLFGRGDPTLMARGQGGPDPLAELASQAWAAGVRTVDGDLLGDDSFFATACYGAGWECSDLPFAFAAETTALSIHDNTVELRVYPGTRVGQPCLIWPMPGQGLLTLVNHTRTQVGGQGVLSYRALGESSILVTGALAPGADPAQLTVTVHEPALWFAQLLERALRRRGIQVRGRVRAVHFHDRPIPLDPSQLVELGHLQSPPVANILRATLKDSINLNAQLLFLQAGAAAAGTGPNHEGRASAALDTFLAAAKLPGGVFLEEGSGLSRKDLVTPDAVVALLAYLSHSPAAAAFRAALPLAGLDGTLRARMEGTRAQGQIQAKTGTLSHVYALSGYATSAAGERLAFSILLNNYLRGPKDPSPLATLDAIAVCLAQRVNGLQEPEAQ